MTFKMQETRYTASVCRSEVLASSFIPSMYGSAELHHGLLGTLLSSLEPRGPLLRHHFLSPGYILLPRHWPYVHGQLPNSHTNQPRDEIIDAALCVSGFDLPPLRCNYGTILSSGSHETITRHPSVYPSKPNWQVSVRTL